MGITTTERHGGITYRERDIQKEELGKQGLSRNILDLSLGTVRKHGQCLSLRGSQESEPQKEATGGGGVKAQRQRAACVGALSRDSFRITLFQALRT